MSIKTTLYWDGFCPESKIMGLHSEMRLNTDDLWESELTGLQVAVPYPGVQAVVMKSRGKGKYRKNPEFASKIANGELLSPQISDRFPYCENPFTGKADFVKFLAVIETMNPAHADMLCLFSAKDIVNLYFEVFSSSNDSSLWNERLFDKNEYKLWCYRKLKSLCEAFETGNCNYIKEGKFIYGRKDSIYKPFFKQVNSEYKSKKRCLIEKNDFTTDHVHHTFKELWRFREELTHVLDSGGQVWEASPAYAYPHYMIGDIKKDIQARLKDIDHVLITILSPDKKQFTKKELIDKFNFPDYNIVLDDWDEF